jgi:hypothetical protein
VSASQGRTSQQGSNQHSDENGHPYLLAGTAGLWSEALRKAQHSASEPRHESVLETGSWRQALTANGGSYRIW